MVLLYKDPKGESVMEKTNTAGSLDGKAATKLSTTKTDSDLETKITSLQKLLKERDDTINKLEHEITLLKVCSYGLEPYTRTTSTLSV